MAIVGGALARFRCSGCRSSTSRSAISSSTGSSSPRPGTSFPATRATFPSGTARSSAPACTRRPRSRRASTCRSCGRCRRRRWWRSAGRGAGRRRVPRQGRARRALRAGDARVHVRRRHDLLNTPIDGGPGVYLSAVPCPSRSVAGVDVLPAGARRGARDAGDRLRHLSLAAWRRPLRDPRRRRRRGSAGRADLPLQDGGVRGVVRPGGVAGGIHALFVSYVTGRRYVHDHRAAHRRADERARRHAAMGRPRGGSHDHHGVALCVHGGRSRGRRQGGLRRGADRRHPVHAAGRARRPRGAPPAQARSGDRRAGVERDDRGGAIARGAPGRRGAHPRRRAESARRFGACAHSTASTSTCARAKFSASSGRTARASRRSSIS